MFTGIVQGTATVRSVSDAGGVRRLVLSFPAGATEGLVRGASVAVAGTCLTAVDIDRDEVSFDVIDETLRRTTLGALTPGGRANFERAARFGDEIGGHLLSGHVLTTAVVADRREDGANLRLTLEVDADTVRYVLPKGYVALDGVSLTVGEVAGGRFDVHLIPETRRVTTLGALRPGDRVNVEVDATTQAVVATVERIAARGR
jgi:riboflavin synthase